MKTKICTKCHKEKPLSEFYKQKLGKFRVRADCKECQKNYKDYNKNRIQKKQKEWYDKNKVVILKKYKKYRDQNKKEIAIYQKDYRDNNKLKISKYKKQYIKENKKIINLYFNNRNKNDISFKITGNLRNRINKALNGKNKSLNTMMLIGCEIDYLMYHLQSQFTKGMSWDNYGTWHIDHIKPCASFDLSKPTEQQKCFNFKNLQPLWAIDNLKKKDKILN